MGKSVRTRQRNCDYMKKTKARVQLIRYTGASGDLIASSARLCYAKNTETTFDQDPGHAGEFKKIKKRYAKL